MKSCLAIKLGLILSKAAVAWGLTGYHPAGRRWWMIALFLPCHLFLPSSPPSSLPSLCLPLPLPLFSLSLTLFLSLFHLSHFLSHSPSFLLSFPFVSLSCLVLSLICFSFSFSLQLLNCFDFNPWFFFFLLISLPHPAERRLSKWLGDVLVAGQGQPTTFIYNFDL